MSIWTALNAYCNSIYNMIKWALINILQTNLCLIIIYVIGTTLGTLSILNECRTRFYALLSTWNHWEYASWNNNLFLFTPIIEGVIWYWIGTWIGLQINNSSLALIDTLRSIPICSIIALRKALGSISLIWRCALLNAHSVFWISRTLRNAFNHVINNIIEFTWWHVIKAL